MSSAKNVNIKLDIITFIVNGKRIEVTDQHCKFFYKAIVAKNV